MKATERGFLYNDFTDLEGKKCSLQESSAATANCIWLGADGEDRMHLEQLHVEELILPVFRDYLTGGFRYRQVFKDRYAHTYLIDVYKDRLIVGVWTTPRLEPKEPMHLNDEMVTALIPLLEGFVKNGNLR